MRKIFQTTWLYALVIILALVSCHSDNNTTDTPKIDEIQQRGMLLVGSLGDYRPLSYLDPSTEQYWGYDVELAEIIAKSIGVKVMVNPGGLNEKFARANLQEAQIIVHQRNEEIPSLIAQGEADVMITEIVEAPYYVQTDERLAAPLLNQPFTNGEIGVLMRKGDEDLLQKVNKVIEACKKDGTLRRLHEKYGFIYKY